MRQDPKGKHDVQSRGPNPSLLLLRRSGLTKQPALRAQDNFACACLTRLHVQFKVPPYCRFALRNNSID
jgi:hypothetical protein